MDVHQQTFPSAVFLPNTPFCQGHQLICFHWPPSLLLPSSHSTWHCLILVNVSSSIFCLSLFSTTVICITPILTTSTSSMTCISAIFATITTIIPHHGLQYHLYSPYLHFTTAISTMWGHALNASVISFETVWPKIAIISPKSNVNHILMTSLSLKGPSPSSCLSRSSILGPNYPNIFQFHYLLNFQNIFWIWPILSIYRVIILVQEGWPIILVSSRLD